MTEEKPPFTTKFQKGDWVHYRDDKYQIITFDNNVHGWQYIIKSGSWVHQVNIKEGDKYFRKA